MPATARRWNGPAIGCLVVLFYQYGYGIAIGRSLPERTAAGCDACQTFVDAAQASIESCKDCISTFGSDKAAPVEPCPSDQPAPGDDADRCTRCVNTPGMPPQACNACMSELDKNTRSFCLACLIGDALRGVCSPCCSEADTVSRAVCYGRLGRSRAADLHSASEPARKMQALPDTRPSGGVVYWGSSGFGQIEVPQAVLANVVDIAVGSSYYLALLSNGTVIAWGSGLYGQTNVPTAALSEVESIAASREYSLALRSDGRVVAWGDSPLVTNVPAAAQASVIQIAAGEYHALALLRNGSVVGWGNDTWSQASVPAGLADVQGIAAGEFHSLALLSNGTVTGWGRNQYHQTSVPADLADVKSVAAAWYHSLALLNNGTVVAWGDDEWGQINVPTAARSQVTAIATESAHSLALLSNGTVVAWGWNDSGATSVPPTLSNVLAIAASTSQSMAIQVPGPPTPPPLAPAPRAPPPFIPGSTGRVVGWGRDEYGQVEVLEAAFANVVNVAAGDYHSLALLSSGMVVAWGANDKGQADVPAGALSGVVDIAASSSYSLALRSDGRVVAWGVHEANDYTVPSNVTGNVTHVPAAAQANVVKIAAGSSHALALLSNGSVVAWGGDDVNNQTSVPTGLSDVREIAAGAYVSLTVYGNGRLAWWGPAGRVPSDLDGKVKSVAVGQFHILALLTNGTVVAWGNHPKYSNEYGQLDVPPEARSDVSEISAGPFSSLALLGNGKVVAWGLDMNVNFPSNLSSVIRICSGLHALALQKIELPPAPPIGTRLPPPAVPGGDLDNVPATNSAHSPAASGGGIAGIVVGVVVGVAALALLGWWAFRRRRAAFDFSVQSNLITTCSTDADSASVQLTGAIGKLDGKPRTTSSTKGSSHVQFSPGLSSAMSDDAAYQARILKAAQIQWRTIDLVKVLGVGGFGTVHKGTWQGNDVAVKMLNITQLTSNAQDELRREALAMCELRHPCIAQVFGLVDDGTHTALVMRYYKRGTVAAAMRKPEYMDLDMSQRLRMALQVASGMWFLHDRQVLHGDLKTSNLLVEDTGRGVVIADFGLSCMAGQAVASGALTVSISPPEVLLNPTAPRTASGDVFAFSIVLLELMTGQITYQTISSYQLRSIVCQGRRPGIPHHVPEDVAAIIRDCWSQEASSRPTFIDVLERLKAAYTRIVPSQQATGPDPVHVQGYGATTTQVVTLADLTTIA